MRMKVKRTSCPDYHEDDQVAQACIKLLSEIFNVHTAHIRSQTTFKGDLNADDLDGFLLQTRLKKELGICLETTKNRGIHNVDDFVHRCKEELGKKFGWPLEPPEG